MEHPLKTGQVVSGIQPLCTCLGKGASRPIFGNIIRVLQNPSSLKWWYIIQMDDKSTVGVVQDNVEEVL